MDIKITQKACFEIHITVDHNQLYLFTLFCCQHGYTKDFAIGPWLYPHEQSPEGSNQQLMLTKTVNDTLVNAIKIGQNLCDQLTQFGINVQRLKLEVPAKSKFTKTYLQECPMSTVGTGYFEFHFKVQVISESESDKITNISKKHLASFSYNAFSKKPGNVLTTLRTRAAGFDEALKSRELYINDLESCGLFICKDPSGTHYEFVVHDTNYALDDGFVPRLC